ncbi:MAG: type II toxin-antitoxin system VapC family toxin, partial [Candidatus Caldarchaeum sp.]
DGEKALEAMGAIGLIVDNIDWNDLSEILRIAESTKLTIYDAEYMYLAKRIGCKLLTVDTDIIDKGGSITEITTFDES